MSCGSCQLQHSFGKPSRKRSRKSHKRSQKGSRKSRKGSRKSRKGSHKGRKGSSKGRKGSSKGRKGSRKGRKGSSKGRKGSSKGRKSRRFGSVSGPGYEGATSYPNGYVPYFGNSQPFVNASGWWSPVTDNVTQSQTITLNP